MPKGVYIRTAYHREINGRGHRGKSRLPHKLNCICIPCKLKRGEINQKGVNNPMYGKRWHHTLAVRKQLSELYKGENGNNWQGGITPEHRAIRNSIEYHLWRESVYARDHWTCQNCGCHKYLHAHHIKRFAKFPELRFAIDNGVTLCKLCHKMIHKEGVLP